jgi:hypothetical protein
MNITFLELINLPYNRLYTANRYKCYHGNCGKYFFITATDSSPIPPSAPIYTVRIREGKIFEYLVKIMDGIELKKQFTFIRLQFNRPGDESIETISINNDHQWNELEQPIILNTNV